MEATQEKQRWLSTGEAAQLCSVARDTVFKWIRRGRLPASRTAGGHYRIAPADLQRVVPSQGVVPEPPSRRSQPLEAPMRCWGYLSETGEPREECRQCLAYRVGATWCFLLRQEQGAGGVSFCSGPGSCGECPYYRRVLGLSTRVLVISADEDLRATLSDCGEDDLEFHFARTGYEAATLLPECYPAIAVVDSEVDQGGGATLVSQLADDSRIRGLRIIYLTRRGTVMPPQGLGPRPGTVEVVTKPLGLAGLRFLRDRFPVERLDVAQRGAVAQCLPRACGTSE